ncbi:MAG: hypothetical protein ACF8MF_06760 [Phycisphaerales bacterium JB052]
MEQSLVDQMTPWLGGGAVTAIASITFWLWSNYFKRDSEQRQEKAGFLDDMRRDRDHWREMASSRQGELISAQGLVDELRKQNAALEQQNRILQTQLDIMHEEKEALLRRLEALEE